MGKNKGKQQMKVPLNIKTIQRNESPLKSYRMFLELVAKQMAYVILCTSNNTNVKIEVFLDNFPLKSHQKPCECNYVHNVSVP